jgi:MoaA/NifB/PqqE/SkfB family radical SAM enzyme
MFNGDKFQVHWEPSDKCNSRCPMCPRFTDDGFEVSTLSNTEWTLEQFKKSWPKKFIQENLKKILACGNFGDPCACREFVDIYEYVREVNPSIGLACNTNGSLRTPQWWARLGAVMTEKQNLGNYCTFSVDGLEDTNHLYRRKTNFKKIMENAQAFIDAGGIAHWDFIVFEYNQHQVEEARNLAIKMGFKNFNIKRTTRWQNYENDQGSYKVFENGKYLYDLKQPSEESFKHDFENSTLFQNQERQSVTVDGLKNLLNVQKEFSKLKGKNNKDNRYANGKWNEIELNKLSIACRSCGGARPHHPYNEIYIAANGFVSPCCFLGSEPFHNKKERSVDSNYIKIVDIDGGTNAFNIHEHNLFDILDKDLFRKLIPDTWDNENGNTSMRPMKCGQCCGIEWNGLDFGELGDKQNSYIGDDNGDK